MTIRALAFDVFGTVADWRSSVARESAVFLARIGHAGLDPERFTDQWRARYQPAMAAVRDSRRGFVILDVLHRDMLVDLLGAHDIDVASLDPALIDDWARAWHRLDPWPEPHAYLATATLLGIAPEELCLVAAHHSDLSAARACGLQTACIDRPMEYGGARAPDADAVQQWAFAADSLTGLADQLGC